MKLFTCQQIAEIDRLTMKHEPILSIDLMERAAQRVAEWILQKIVNDQPFYIFAGPGNNGGDALAVARMLAGCNYTCTVFLADFGRELKDDAAINLTRLKEQNKVLLKYIDSEDSIPEIPNEAVVIDGLFGSGINKSLEGLAREIVRKINQSGATVISIDIPSGLFGEDNTQNDLSGVVRASYTLSFQFPKISFLFPENADIVGDWEVLPIGLHPEAILQAESKYFNLTKTYISGTIKKRAKFSHKGIYGHALLIAGSYGKMGAAVLASRACLRAGVGLLTSHIPRLGYEIIQNSVPEAMTSIDHSDTVFTEFPELGPFSAIGVGPGLEKKPETQMAFKKLLQAKPKKMVIDADALNILSENKDWLELLPENTVLTPHPKEFERLAGETSNSFERLQKQLQFSVNYKVIIVLKGAHTCITVPDGSAFFNSTGNPGMATAGSGDVLTGIILGLLAQNYTAEEATLIGVYIHGLAGDLAAAQFGQQALIAGDIITKLGQAFLQLE
ncbi:MAG TPA: bifunctional ADP-dependent NAD(P)H-hydrate dehydratase/NAD(P)H-hydrate epimerase [Prolixibacteraceae bacterium]|nr:bifunctional ADP-dependent NAD(P)H-hydrate dehydratase/NAD(P)H-hydrate epimerase [Prolixibacteraceae bacterium]